MVKIAYARPGEVLVAFDYMGEGENPAELFANEGMIPVDVGLSVLKVDRRRFDRFTLDDPRYCGKARLRLVSCRNGRSYTTLQELRSVLATRGVPLW